MPAGESALVWVTARETAAVRAEARIREFDGDATYHRADVRHESQVDEFVRACVRRYERIDIALNNAGIETPKAVPVHEPSLADFENV